MRELFFRCHYEVGSGRHEEACSIPGIHWFVLFLQCHKESGVEAKSNGAKPKYLHLIYVLYSRSIASAHHQKG